VPLVSRTDHAWGASVPRLRRCWSLSAAPVRVRVRVWVRVRVGVGVRVRVGARVRVRVRVRVTCLVLPTKDEHPRRAAPLGYDAGAVLVPG